MPADRPIERPLTSPSIQATLVLVALLLVFFWTPISRGGYYAPTDVLQESELLRVAPPDYVSKNRVSFDIAQQNHPFLEWNRAQLWAGSLPLWNPYNGWGAPHLANYQSAVFSPFSLPFYVLSFRHAIIAAAFLKLLGSGCFTYLFLRRLAVHHAAALVGAVAFTFGGYNVLWLHWTNVNASVALPAGLYFAEVAFQTNRTQAARRGLALVGVTLALTTGLLAGHPETFFWSGLLVGAYVLFRSLCTGESWGQRLRYLAEFGAAAAAALGLAAAQLLPFFEYLSHSSVLVLREAGRPIALWREFAPLQAFPQLLGSRAFQGEDPRFWYDDPVYWMTGMNFAEANGNYIGLIILFLAGLAVMTLPRRRSPPVTFFAAVGLLWLVCAYDLWGAREWRPVAEFLKVGHISRSQLVWLLSVSCLAAFAVDSLRTGGASLPRCLRRRIDPAALLAGGIVLWALVLLLVAFLGAYALLQWAAMKPGNGVGTEQARATVLPHLVFLTSTFVAGVASVALFVAIPIPRRSERLYAILCGTLVVLVFLQSGFMLRDYMPTIDEAYFYPMTPALAEVAQRTGAEQTLWVDGATIPANSNLWYRLRSPSNYDVLGVRAYDKLYVRLIRSPSWAHPASPTSLRSLQVMGIQFVVTTQPYPFGSAVPGLERIWTDGRFSIFRVPDSLPRYFTVARGLPVWGDDEALELLERPDFDIAGTVLLHTEHPIDVAGGDRGARAAEILEEAPTRARLLVERDSPGWLVALQSFYPGWTVTVNGLRQDLVRANVAFSAVPVGAGVTEVVLEYDPPSVKLGLLVSGATAAAMLATTAMVVDRARRPREPQGRPRGRVRPDRPDGRLV
jgi:hypothetical protein